MEPEAPEPDDYASLLAAARAGDDSSLWRLCDNMRPRLRNFAAGQLDPEVSARVDPSDIVQDALLAATKAFPQFRGQTNEEWEAWLIQIVRREALDARRYWRQPRRTLNRQSANLERLGDRDALPSSGSSPSSATIRAEVAWAVMELIARLPPDEEHVVRMRHIEGRSLAEMAESIGRTPEATAGLLKRAMARLREWLPKDLAD